MSAQDERWAQVETLFAAALEQAPEARDSFVEAAVDASDEVREDVASLLHAHARESGQLEASVRAAAGVAIEQADPLAGGDARIGPYRVLRRLGTGGMGTVYLAERADAQFRQQVALKVVNRHLVNDEIVRRFRTERQILADLDHPNIAHLLDGGTTADGLPYLVMEYVVGERIDAYCNARALALRERLALFLAVCDAVQYAHRNLVIHRDIKPSNILVTPDGAPKLLDFGIAKLMGTGAERGAALTRADERLMTPEHASPEQVRGEPVTTGSDVYALGILLYHLLTGERPYTPDDGSVAALERAICETAPDKPSTVVMRAATRAGNAAAPAPVPVPAPRRLARALTGDLDNIVLMALRKEPARRYASAAQMAEDVRRYLDQRPVIARPDTWSYRTAKFLRRHTASVTAAAAVVVVLAAVVVYYTQRLAGERDRAQDAERRAVRETETSKRVSDFLVELFRVSDPDKARGETITAREILDRGAERIDQELDDEPEVQAQLMDTMGLVYRSLGLYGTRAV